MQKGQFQQSALPLIEVNVNASPRTPTPFDLDDTPVAGSNQDVAAKKRRVRFRIAVGVLVAVTGILNAFAWTYARNRLDYLIAHIRVDGGIVEYSSGELVGIDFGPVNAEDHLNNLPRMGSVRD